VPRSLSGTRRCNGGEEEESGGEKKRMHHSFLSSFTLRHNSRIIPLYGTTHAPTTQVILISFIFNFNYILLFYFFIFFIISFSFAKRDPLFFSFFLSPTTIITSLHPSPLNTTHRSLFYLFHFFFFLNRWRKFGTILRKILEPSSP